MCWVFQSQNQNDEMESDEFEESWLAVPLERVKVPRPPQKSISKKNCRILKQWHKQEISQLQLLEEGISQAKRINDEKSPKKETPAISNLKMKCTSPAKSADNTNKRTKFSASDTPGSNTRPRISLKISRTIKSRPSVPSGPVAVHSSATSKTTQRLDFKLPTPEKYKPFLKISNTFDPPGAGATKPKLELESYDGYLIAKKVLANNPARKLAEARSITTADRSAHERNENLGSFEITDRSFGDGSRNLSKVAIPAQVSGESTPAWTKQPKDMGTGAGQRSPHEGPVSDSELNNLLAAQFEDCDF